MSGYGEAIADVYDLVHPLYEYLDAEVESAALAKLAGPGPALELGVGNGRVALPLAERGVEVHGVDSSPAMLEELRRADPGGRVHAALGDFERLDVSPDLEFTLVFAVFHTFYCLRTQEAQLRCMRDVAGRLADGGRFVIEGFVPEPESFTQGQRVRVVGLDGDRVVLAVSKADRVTQRIDTQLIVFTRDGDFRLVPWMVRYSHPPELDLMARLAGLELEVRWADWTGGEFDASSRRHVSIYRR